MSEIGPSGRWVIVRDIKADPGGCMAIIESEAYRTPCMAHNPGIPVYTRQELEMVKSIPHSAEVFRSIQRVKRVFPASRVVASERGAGENL